MARISPRWVRRGGWARLPAWEKETGTFLGVTTRSLGDMKDGRRLSSALRAAGLGPGRWAGGAQVHGARVAVVRGPTAPIEIPDTDGLATRVPGLGLRVLCADCVPAFLLDPGRAVGLLHAGRRGIERGILARGVRTLARRFGSRPARLRLALGPHIRACCYEVGPEAAKGFRGVPGAVRASRPGPPRLDMAAALAFQARRAGVRRLSVAPWCTACDPGFHSYRRDRTDCRHAAVIAFK